MKAKLITAAMSLVVVTAAWMKLGTDAQTRGIVLPPRADKAAEIPAAARPASLPVAVGSAPYRLRVEFDEARAMIDGQVPNETTRIALLQALQDKVDPLPLRANISVDPALSEPLAEVIQTIVGQTRRLTAAQLELTHTKISLVGRAASPAEKQSIAEALRAAMPFGVALDLRIDLPLAQSSVASRKHSRGAAADVNALAGR